MALQKTATTDFGISVKYHKINALYINWFKGEAFVELGSWPTELIRRDGKQPLTAVQYEWRKENFAFNPDEPIVVQAYTKLKEKPEWADAVDV